MATIVKIPFLKELKEPEILSPTNLDSVQVLFPLGAGMTSVILFMIGNVTFNPRENV